MLLNHFCPYLYFEKSSPLLWELSFFALYFTQYCCYLSGGTFCVVVSDPLMSIPVWMASSLVSIDVPCNLGSVSGLGVLQKIIIGKHLRW